MIDFLQTIQTTIQSQGLLEAGDGVLVGLSGGADSVCLLSVLLELREQYALHVCAAHLHHGLRGSEADADAAFAEALCKEKNIPLFVRYADIQAEAQAAKIGLEEAGRRARYLFFEEIKSANGLQKIATAHHADDNTETVLMRIMRGTGPLGLGGIPYRNGAVIRPLLDVSRAEIEAYLLEKGQSFQTDSTNFETEFMRNKIRNRLIPAIEQEYNPNFRRSFQKNIRLYAAAASFLEAETERAVQTLSERVWGGFRLSCKQLLAQPPYLTDAVLHKLIAALSHEECGITAVESAKAVLQRGRGSAELSGRVTATACYGSLYLRTAAEPKPFCHTLAPQGRFTVFETGQCLVFEHISATPQHPAADCAYINPEMLSEKELTVRSRREGDVFYPTGMTGKKTVKKYFIDAKIPHFMRDAIPLLTIDNKEVVWVVGHRMDRRFAAKAGAAALCVKMIEGAANDSVGK